MSKRKTSKRQQVKAQQDKAQQKAEKRGNTKHFSVSTWTSMNRRFLLRSGAAVGVAVLAGGWIHAYDSQSRLLHDLSTIGSGHPVVLQVHDPSCSMCRQLKRSTETALKRFPEIKYRIADLSSSEGSAFAAKFKAAKVTLLLFDPKGDLVGSVQGVKQATELEGIFSRYLKSENT